MKASQWVAKKIAEEKGQFDNGPRLSPQDRVGIITGLNPKTLAQVSHRGNQITGSDRFGGTFRIGL